MILCIIPARSGSKGLPGKHMKLINGKPVIGYTIDTAKKVKLLDRIVVSSNDREILSYCDQNDVEIIERPDRYATDKSPINDTLSHAVKVIEKQCSIDFVVWLQANVPIRKYQHITEIIDRLINSSADSVISLSKVGWPVEKALGLTDDLYCYSYFNESPIAMNRQDYRESYYPNGSIYAIRKNSLMRKKRPSNPYNYFLGEKVLGYVMNKYKYGIEIDNEQDLKLCKLYINSKVNKRDSIF